MCVIKMCYLIFYNLKMFYLFFPAHQGRVVDIVFSVWSEWVLSVGRDKYFQWHCSETGQRQGGFQCNAWCTAVQYPFYQNFHFYIWTVIVIVVLLQMLREWVYFIEGKNEKIFVNCIFPKCIFTFIMKLKIYNFIYFWAKYVLSENNWNKCCWFNKETLFLLRYAFLGNLKKKKWKGFLWNHMRLVKEMVCIYV